MKNIADKYVVSPFRRAIIRSVAIMLLGAGVYPASKELGSLIFSTALGFMLSHAYFIDRVKRRIRNGEIISVASGVITLEVDDGLQIRVAKEVAGLYLDGDADCPNEVLLALGAVHCRWPEGVNRK